MYFEQHGVNTFFVAMRCNWVEQLCLIKQWQNNNRDTLHNDCTKQHNIL